MPFKVFEFDTIIEHHKVYQIFSEEKTARFVAQKMYVGKRYSNIESLKLPNNKKGLKRFYLDFINYLDVIVEDGFDYQNEIKKTI